MTIEVLREDPEFIRLEERLRTIGRFHKDALAIGDILLEIDNKWGQSAAFTTAEALGMDRGNARQRIWLSLSIPATETELRQLRLNYTHLRCLATVPRGRRLQLARRVAQGNWTVERLRREIGGTAGPSALASNEHSKAKVLAVD